MEQEESILPIRKSLRRVDGHDICDDRDPYCEEGSVVRRKCIILVVDQDDCLYQAAREEDTLDIPCLPRNRGDPPRRRST